MTIQELQFELIKKSSFNEFDGEKVVKDLEDNKELWRGAVMTCGSYSRPNSVGYSDVTDLLCLRDISENYWNVDTLFITPKLGKEEELEKLAKSWGADEIDYYGGEQACDMLGSSSPELRANKKQILRIWWD
jgi:hypothetical protein